MSKEEALKINKAKKAPIPRHEQVMKLIEKAEMTEALNQKELEIEIAQRNNETDLVSKLAPFLDKANGILRSKFFRAEDLP